MTTPKQPYVSLYSGHPPEVNFEALRKALLKRDGLVHYATVGYFLQWFAAVEKWLDMLLAWALEHPDLIIVEVIIKGLAARNKVERLRAVCKLRGVSMGPNFAARLSHFEGRICRLRNELAHNWLLHTPQGDFIEFTQASPMDGQKPRPKRLIRSMEVFDHGAWLHLYQDDLNSVFSCVAPQQLRRLRTLEIVDPKSGLPKAQDQSSRPKVPDASGDKPARKRDAKPTPPSHETPARAKKTPAKRKLKKRA